MDTITSRTPRRTRTLAVLLILALSSVACSSSGTTTDPVLTPSDGEPTSDPVVETIEEAAAPAESTTPTTLPPPERPESVFVAADVPGLIDDAPTMRIWQSLAPAADRPEWTVVGTVRDGTERRAIVWTSPEGDMEAAVQSELPGGVESDAFAVTSSDDAVVVVGSQGSGENRTPAVWSKASGDDEWELLASAGFAPEVQSMTNVAFGDGLLVATGRQEFDSGDTGLALAISADGGTSWTQSKVDDGGIPADTWMHGVAEFNGKFVAIGRSFDGDTQRGVGRAWTSSDRGATWELVADNGLWSEADDHWLGGLAEINGKLFTVGGTKRNDEFTPEAWSTVDGESWVREATTFAVTNDGRAAATGIGAWNVTTNGDVLVANAWTSWTPEVWISTDGVTWETTPGFRSLDPRKSIAIAHIGVEPDGTIVAFEASDEPMVRSNTRWQRVAQSEEFPVPTDVPSVQEIAYRDGRFVVAGRSIEGRANEAYARFWWSDNGTDWNLAKDTPRRSSHVADLVATNDGFVAVGTVGASEQEFNRPARFWHSTDGISWTVSDSLGNPEVTNLTVSDVAILGEELFVVGEKGDIAEDFFRRPIVAFGDTDGTNFSSEVAARVSHLQHGIAACANEERAVSMMIRDNDGHSVHVMTYDTNRVPTEGVAIDGTFDVASSQRVNDCNWTGSEFIAVGAASNGVDDDGIIWRSTDGLEWSQLVGPDGLSGDAFQAVNRVVAFDGGLIIIGRNEGSHDGSILWAYRNGSWTVLENPFGLEEPADASIGDILIADDKVVAIGGLRGTQQIWSAPLDNLLNAIDESAK